MNLSEFVHFLEGEKGEHTLDWFARGIFSATEKEELTELIERLTELNK